MKNNKDIVIDGVRYKLSPADWNLQQQILSRARVVRADKAPKVKSAKTPEKLTDAVVKEDKAPKVKSTPETAPKIAAAESLTDAVVNRLVGHTNVVYYNCEINAWNTTKYNGKAISNLYADTKLVKEFKSAMGKMSKFNRQYEFAAFVTMIINKASFPGRSKPINNPQYSNTGTAIVGNIIVKNKATGKYELYCKSWVGAFAYNHWISAIDYVACKFASFGAKDSEFRKELVDAHTR